VVQQYLNGDWRYFLTHFSILFCGEAFELEKKKKEKGD